MHLTALETAAQLTQAQQLCITQLTTEWQEKGYNTVQADILWALGDSKLYGNYGELVDCMFYKPVDQYGRYRHKLTPLGLEVKAILQADVLFA